MALTVLGQQVSLAAGRLFATRLVSAFGTTPSSGMGADGLHQFPTAARLATVPTDALGAAVGFTGHAVERFERLRRSLQSRTARQ